jgi:hypothetical protein
MLKNDAKIGSKNCSKIGAKIIINYRVNGSGKFDRDSIYMSAVLKIHEAI